MPVVSERVRADLFGHDRAQSRRAFGVALVLGFLVAGLAIGVNRRGRIPAAFEYITPAAVGVSLASLLLGCVAAGINAARNGGLVPSWGLVLAPLSAWLGVYHYDPAHPLSTLAVVAGVSLVAVPVAGTVAHAVGRLVQLHAEGDTWSASVGPVLRILVGFSPKRTGGWGVLAIILLLIAVGSVVWDLLPVAVFVPFGTLGGPLITAGVMLGWIGVAALPGYRQEGFIASWALVFGPTFGGLVTNAATDQFMSLPLAVDAVTTGVYALGLSFIGGAIGFLLGALLRRILSEGSLSAIEGVRPRG